MLHFSFPFGVPCAHDSYMMYGDNWTSGYVKIK